MIAEELHIPIEAVEAELQHFINIDNNKRIFFSGKFGIGKTFLLKRFFQSHSEDFETFHLFPVSYQISSNDDIVELLKYDILIDLINRDDQILKDKDDLKIKRSAFLFFTWLRSRYSLNQYLASTVRLAETVTSISPEPSIQIMSRLGRPLRQLLSIDKDFQEFKAKYVAGDKVVIENFLNEVRDKDIKEVDYISYLINSGLSRVKGAKKSVLILDDIDRVDPEHVFRILNIFSSYLDGKDNLFGFDKVLIVGDVENLRSIFHHKYGAGADFQGYFDKFFSLRPFVFDNRKIVLERIPVLVKQIRHEDTQLMSAIGESGYIKLLLSDVLCRAMNINRLNLRQLYKPLTFDFPELRAGSLVRDGFSDEFQQILDIGVKLLLAIFGGDKAYFLEVLTEIRQSIEANEKSQQVPYSRYSAAMLARIVNISSEEEIEWRGYKLSLSNDRYRPNVNVAGPASLQTMVFYDLLAEYVRQGKFNKKNHWEYDT